MEYDTGKRKEKPKRIPRRRLGAIVLIGLACAVFGIVYVINSQRLPTLPPILADTPIVRAPAFPDITLMLNITPQAPEDMVNNQGWGGSQIRENIADRHPTFSSPFLQPPVNATDGMDTVWESDGSTGSWLYVDLGEPTTFRMFTSSMRIDVDRTTPVETYFIVSDDLKTWRVIYDDTDFPAWGNPVILLPQSVTTRYVGLYAQNWGGGQGFVAEFIVLP